MMANSISAVQRPESHFRLLLWLKFRLIYMSYRRNTSRIVSTILAVVFLVPLSVSVAIFVYWFADSHPGLSFFVDRAVLTSAFLFWVLTPLAGFSLNESYDPTRLFVYPVRYQTIFAANVVGGLLEGSTLLFLPILVALLCSTVHRPVAIIFGIFFLLIFTLQTIALGQTITLIFIGFLRSRRFRDMMIVFFPLLMLLRYYFFGRPGQTEDLAALATSPAWNIAQFAPPGWASTAISSCENGDWGKALFFGLLLLGTTAATVALAAVVLKQLFVGDRGVALAVARQQRNERQPATERVNRDPAGVWKPITAVVEKELRYFVRDPQYKSLLVRVAYLLAVFGFSISKTLSRFASHELSGALSDLIRLFFPIVIVALLQFATSSMTYNIFGGEGPAITVLFSFPTRRRYIVIGKNISHGLMIVTMSAVAIIAVCCVAHSFSSLPLSLAWMIMATSITVSVGNLVSIRFPYRIVVRGSKFNAGSSAAGGGCLYGLFFLLFQGLAAIVAIPAAACVLIPGIDSGYHIWYTLSIPMGVAYCVGIYFLSLLIVDSWMIEREQDIVAKLVLTD